MNNRFQRNDSHRLGFQNSTLLNLQMENKAKQRDNTLMFKEKESRNKMFDVIQKIKGGDIPQLKKSMIVEEPNTNKEEEEHKEDVKDHEEQMHLPEIYEEKKEPIEQEMTLVFKQGEPKMKAVVDMAIKRFIKEKSWK